MSTVNISDQLSELGTDRLLPEPSTSGFPVKKGLVKRPQSTLDDLNHTFGTYEYLRPALDAQLKGLGRVPALDMIQTQPRIA